MVLRNPLKGPFDSSANIIPISDKERRNVAKGRKMLQTIVSVSGSYSKPGVIGQKPARSKVRSGAGKELIEKRNKDNVITPEFASKALSKAVAGYKKAAKTALLGRLFRHIQDSGRLR
jgi:hypothetical protein